MNTAELLAWHESEKMLKDFDGRSRELFDEHDIDYARVFARSSNVFYPNYDLYVKKEQEFLSRLRLQRQKVKWITTIQSGTGTLCSMKIL